MDTIDDDAGNPVRTGMSECHFFLWLVPVGIPVPQKSSTKNLPTSFNIIQHLPTSSTVGHRSNSTSALQGDKWQMYIPSELGYGDGGTGVFLGMSSGDAGGFRHSRGASLELQILSFPTR